VEMVGVWNEAAGRLVPGVCTWRAFTRHLLLDFKNRDHNTPGLHVFCNHPTVPMWLGGQKCSFWNIVAYS
jgi:hypothetical protein